MEWDNVKTAVGVFAPTIAASIGGPAAGLGVAALCKVFGLDAASGDIDSQLEAALAQMTPEQALVLQKQDKEFAAEMKRLRVDVFKLEVEDRKSAREMYGKDGLENKVPQWLFGSMLLVGSAWIIWYIMTGQVEDEVDGVMVGTILGYALTTMGTMRDFVFGAADAVSKTLDKKEK